MLGRSSSVPLPDLTVGGHARSRTPPPRRVCRGLLWGCVAAQRCLLALLLPSFAHLAPVSSLPQALIPSALSNATPANLHIRGLGNRTCHNLNIPTCEMGLIIRLAVLLVSFLKWETKILYGGSVIQNEIKPIFIISFIQFFVCLFVCLNQQISLSL